MKINEKSMEESKYKVHHVIYTDCRGKRARAFVAEESGEKALKLLEETLTNFGYSPKNIENLLPVAKVISYTSLKSWIEFERFDKRE